ncbi:MAG: ATP-binding protein, partial [Gammaproteobacteria bacterium]
MNAYAIPPLISAILFCLIGAFAYLKSESRTKLPFVALCFLTVVWQLSWTVLFNIDNKALATAIIKFGYSGIIFIPLVYYHFIIRFCGRGSNSIKLVYAIGGVFLAIHMSSNVFVSGFYSYFWGYYPKAGPAHPLYLSFITISLLAALVILRKEWLASKENKLRHQQVTWVALSFGLYYLAASDFLVNYGIEFYPFGVFFILASLAIIAYAIVKHKLLEIDIVIKKTVFYSCLLALLIAPCLTVIYFTDRYATGSSEYVIYSFLMVLVGFVFPRIKIRTERTLENLLFGSRVDYQTTFEQLSDTLTHLEDLDVVLNKVVETIANAVDTKLFAIYLLSNSTEEYTLTAYYGEKQSYLDKFKMSSIEFGSTVTRRNSINYFLNVDQLDNKYTPIPMVYKDVLIGIILIGDWEGNNKRDTKALMAMANQLAVAVNNSLQMEQIKTLNTQLEEKVNERTRALREAYDELKRSSKYKDQFFSRVSHELRTPLTNIMVPLHSVLDESSDALEEDNLREKQSMLRNASILLKRINDILDIAKLKSGKIPLHIRRCSIVQIIDDVISASKAAAELAGITIHFKPADTQQLYLDRDKVEQIIMNIINNALKFTETGGVINVRLEETSGETKVFISDNGCGISPKETENIFQPFYQTESNTSGSQEGTGLGLAICREFMELHHGNISVESQQGIGTTFALSFQHGHAHFSDSELTVSDDSSQNDGNSALRSAKKSIWHYAQNMPATIQNIDVLDYASTQHKRR